MARRLTPIPHVAGQTHRINGPLSSSHYAAARAWREDLGLDFGSRIDYTLHDGEVILLDANKI